MCHRTCCQAPCLQVSATWPVLSHLWSSATAMGESCSLHLPHCSFALSMLHQLCRASNSSDCQSAFPQHCGSCSCPDQGVRCDTLSYVCLLACMHDAAVPRNHPPAFRWYEAHLQSYHMNARVHRVGRGRWLANAPDYGFGRQLLHERLTPGLEPGFAEPRIPVHGWSQFHW